MSESSLPLKKLCAIAQQAARNAGEFIQHVDRTNLEHTFKQTGSGPASQVVTRVDIGSEAIIRDALELACEEWDIAFVGEESSPIEGVFEPDNAAIPARLLKPYFWCVDPLDGTLPFIEGRPGYAVSIALLTQTGEPLIGVVHDPTDKTLIHAIQRQGAFSGGAALQQQAEKSAELIVFADRSFEEHANYSQAVDILNACAQQFSLDGISLEYGCGAVKNACQVLDHAAACYIKLPKAEEGGGSIWDFGASALIVAEAGGWVSNIAGKPLALNRPGSTFMNDQGVIYASSAPIAKYLVTAFND